MTHMKVSVRGCFSTWQPKNKTIEVCHYHFLNYLTIFYFSRSLEATNISLYYEIMRDDAR